MVGPLSTQISDIRLHRLPTSSLAAKLDHLALAGQSSQEINVINLNLQVLVADQESLGVRLPHHYHPL